MSHNNNNDRDASRPSENATLSAELRQFYDQHGIKGIDEYITTKQAPAARFVRLNPRFQQDETLRLLKASPSVLVSVFVVRHVSNNEMYTRLSVPLFIHSS